MNHGRVAAVVPARDETHAIGSVVRSLHALEAHGRRVVDRVIVADNGSSDGTGEQALAAGATVVREKETGYGAACLAALATMPEDCYDVVLFVDGDASVDVSETLDLLRAIESGADLVIGARRTAAPGALTTTQRIGTALVCFVIRGLWRTPVTDLGPFRAVRTPALARIGMTDRRYGWTVEMQVRAIQEGLTMVEVPVSVRRRVGRSKISGTLRGSLRAGYDMFAVISRLRSRQPLAAYSKQRHPLL